MKTLHINMECPNKGRKLKQYIKAGRMAGFEAIRFTDTFIKVKPIVLRRMKGAVITPKPPKDEALMIDRTIYAILITNDIHHRYVSAINRTEPYPVWKSLSCIVSTYDSIASYYTAKGYEVSLVNTKSNRLIRNK